MSVLQLYLIRKNYFFRWFLLRLGSSVPQIRLKLLWTWIRSWDTDRHWQQAAQPRPAPCSCHTPAPHAPCETPYKCARGSKLSAGVYNYHTRKCEMIAAVKLSRHSSFQGTQAVKAVKLQRQSCCQGSQAFQAFPNCIQQNNILHRARIWDDVVYYSNWLPETIT